MWTRSTQTNEIKAFQLKSVVLTIDTSQTFFSLNALIDLKMVKESSRTIHSRQLRWSVYAIKIRRFHYHYLNDARPRYNKSALRIIFLGRMDNSGHISDHVFGATCLSGTAVQQQITNDHAGH